jgi:hypothetical protein
VNEAIQAVLEGLANGQLGGQGLLGGSDSGSSSDTDSEELDDNPLLDALAKAPLRTEQLQQQRRLQAQQMPGAGQQAEEELSPEEQVGGGGRVRLGCSWGRCVTSSANTYSYSSGASPASQVYKQYLGILKRW